MRPEVGRRAFVGGVVAASAGALAFRAVQGDRVFAQVHRHAGGQLDPMVGLFIQQCRSLREEMRADRLRGEHARRHAAALRMVGTYWGHTGIDETVKTRVRQLIRDRGPEWVLQSPADHKAAIDELTRQGMVDAYDLPDPNTLTREQRLAGLEEILTNGITPLLLRGAGFVERSGRTLDRFAGAAAVVQVARRQDDISCEAAWDMQILPLQAAAVIVCMMPPLWELCALLHADILVMQAMKLYLCW